MYSILRSRLSTYPLGGCRLVDFVSRKVHEILALRQFSQGASGEPPVHLGGEGMVSVTVASTWLIISVER